MADSTSSPLPLTWLDHISRETHDVERLTKFYVDVLGFQTIRRPDFEFDGKWLVFPGCRTALHIILGNEKGPFVPESPHSKETKLTDPSYLRRSPHVAIRTSNMPEVLATLSRLEIRHFVATIPKTDLKQVWFYDPDGYGIEIGEFAAKYPPLLRISEPTDEQTKFFYRNKTVLVTGCSRGIGLEFIRQLSLLKDLQIIATCRNPSKATDLKQILESSQATTHLFQLDVANFDSFGSFVSQLEKTGVKKIDVLVNNAGMSASNHPYDKTTEIEFKDAEMVFRTNVLGAVGVTNSLLHLLERKESHDDGEKGRVVFMSSQLASIRNANGAAQGRIGGTTCYRMSKAALNMAARCIAAEREGLIVVSMSPGHVATDMGSTKGRKPPLSPSQSVAHLLRNIASFEERDSGGFFDYDGSTLPF